MRAIILCVAVIISLLGFSATSAVAENAVHTQKIANIEHPAWVLNDPSSPLFIVQIRIDGGISNDNSDYAGLTSLWSDLLMRGTTSRSFADITKFMKDHAIDISISAGRDDTIVTLKSPSQFTVQSIELLKDMINNPAFAQDELDRIKETYRASFKTNLASPDWRASRIINGVAYKDTAYALPGSGSPATLNRIDLDDIKARHEALKAQKPEHMVAVGDINHDILASIASIWDQNVDDSIQSDQSIDYRDIEGDTKIHHPFDVTQTKINYIVPALAVTHPDYPAQAVLEFVLTNGFGAPLMEALREQSGLSYGVGSYITTPNHGGLWVIGVDVPSDKSADAVAIIEQTLMRVTTDNLITDIDIKEAKHAMTASLAMGWTSSDAIAGILSTAFERGFSPDYLKEWSKKINNVTLNDVIRVARDLMNSNRRLIVSVGQKAPDQDWTIMTDLPNMDGL